MEARNRLLREWFERIQHRQIAMPRFQRMEAWGPDQVAGLLETVLRELPCGATLILEIGDKEPFVRRTMAGAPTEGEKVTEHLLDGQQRLTALWRSLTDDYPDRTYTVAFENDLHQADKQTPVVKGYARWERNGSRYPLWLDDPKETWARSLIPVRLLRPGDHQREPRSWALAAVENDHAKAFELLDVITALREKVSEFNLPFLSLSVTTPKDVAIDVFIKMNTSSVQLTAFDIVVAQMEEATGESLHDLVDGLVGNAPGVEAYGPPSDLVLAATALVQNRVPGQAAYQRLDMEKFVAGWPQLVTGINAMVAFLEEEHIFDQQRLPTEAVLPVIAALWSIAPDKLDAQGNARILMRKYLWRAFLSDRYERSAATNAYQDFRALAAVFQGQGDTDSVPVFDNTTHPLPTLEEVKLAGWPKNRHRLGRAILALSLRGGALDIADAAPASREQLKKREYHHLFPRALLAEAGKQDEDINIALNCALVTWHTNRTMSAKEPLQYLRERAEANLLGKEEIRRRLASHLVPFDELAGAGYNGLQSVEAQAAKIRGDYDAFLSKRAESLLAAADEVCQGTTWTGVVNP